jgi:hypothetical protein
MSAPSLGLNVRDNETMQTGVITDINYWPGILTSDNAGTLSVEMYDSENQVFYKHYGIYGWDTYLTVLD